MSLSVQMRRVGEVVVIACRGTIIGGPDTDTLQAKITPLLPLEPNIVLDGGEVGFLDSSGVGVLVRLLHRTRSASGDLKLCALTRRVAEMLRITRLADVFDVHAREDEAIAAFYQPPRSADARQALAGDVLCVDESPDLLAYICGVLRAAGYRVMPCSNVSDAAVLLKVSSPRAVVVGAGGRARLDTVGAHARGAGGSHNGGGTLPIVELPAGFGGRDPLESSSELVSLVRGAVGDG